MENIKKISKMAHKNIPATGYKGAEERWFNKAINKRKVLYDGTSLLPVTLIGPGEISIDAMTSSYFSTVLKIKTNTIVENKSPRPRISLKFSWNEEDFSSYNRIEAWVFPQANGYHNFYYHFAFGNEGEQLVHAPSLEANRWNRVVWEINNVNRNKVKNLVITPALMGCPPEAEPELTIYIGHIEIQEVEPEYEEGWDLQNRIAYSHIGYFPNQQKIAITQITATDFKIIDINNQIVYSDNLVVNDTNLGKVYIADFTNFNKEGVYKIKIGQEMTECFPINTSIYDSSIWKSLNFLRSLRCGEDVEGVHSACHLNCKTVHPDGRMVPNFGGWHDAGDVSQFLIPTAEIVSSLLDLAQSVSDQDLQERLIEEAKIGTSWLLRTRFGDGYRAMAVTYNYWRSNILEADNDSVWQNKAENGPFENFLAAIAEIKAYHAFRESDPVYADWCLRCGKEDYNFAKIAYKKGLFTKRWGPTIDSQTSGVAVITACLLYEITNKEKYINDAIKYAKKVLLCQQSTYPTWEKPIRGFFYEDEQHSKILTYEHRGHEQSPIEGLVKLYSTIPNHPFAVELFEGIKLYKEYIESTINYSAPYGFLPAHVYIIPALNLDRFTIPSYYGDKEKAFTDLSNQIKEGIKLNEEVYLRLLPVAIQRRGYLATLLSKTKAVSLIASLFEDSSLKQITINQIEWTFGKNPFATSQMYQEGYNYHPLYVAFSKQIVGALPVGFKTYKNNDAPYWPVANNAVYKEVWGHTTGKYLSVISDIIKK